MSLGGKDEKALGKQIGLARRNAGLTQQELCQQSGLSYSTLAKIERGAIKSPSIFTILQIAKSLDLPVSELIGEEETSQNSVAKKRSKSGIEFIYFDVNGCLVRGSQQAFTNLAEETGLTPDRIESSYWHYNDAVCRGEMSLAELGKALGENLNITPPDWGKLYLNAVESIPESVEMVRWAAKYYRIGLMTNIMPGMIRGLLNSNKLPDVEYDAIIDSSQVGAIKPEAKIINTAQKEAGVNAESILLVDDSRVNLISAEKLGWKVCWFDDYRPSDSVGRVKKILDFK